jgi:pyruvate/2-oxoglutarate/acetoin dehydrogenase E1 component
MNYSETIAHETAALMERDPRVVVMGAGVTDENGIFGTTKLARERFPDRVIETPLSETMLTGALVGMAQNGWKPIFVHARADFMTLSMEHLINTAAKWGYMGSDPPNLMIRCIIGQGWGNGPQHTQSTAHWFASTPGLRTVLPASKPFITDLFRSLDDGPVISFEHRRLYNSNIPTPAPKSSPVDVCLVGMSATVLDCIEAAKMLNERGIRTVWRAHEVTRTLDPYKSCKTYVVVDVGHGPYGLGTWPAMKLREAGMRVSLLYPPEYPVPASYPLEAEWYTSPVAIANEALEMLGEQDEFNNENLEPFAPTGGPF